MHSGKGMGSSEHSPGRAKIQQLSDKLNALPYNPKEDSKCVEIVQKDQEAVGRAETKELR